MKKPAIIGIIVIMSIALAGLLIIQLYWITSASTVKEAGFRRSVNDAMVRVVYKLEQFEKRKASELNPTGPGLVNIRQHLDYSEFITKKQLDSLITLELNIRGIDTRFQFGIYAPEQDAFLMEKSTGFRKELIGKGYAFPLFTYDLISAPEYLILWFPNEKSFLLTELWGMLLVSIILIVIIVYTFIFTISLLLRQKRISDMKTDFINNMTHEFKTPISTISLACEALNDEDLKKSGEVYNSYISVIDEENRRLGVLAERVLQAALLDKGELKLKTEWVNINDLVIEAVKKIQLQVERRGGKVYKDIHAETGIIKADRFHLTNAIMNLLDNANKYSAEEPQIFVETKENEEGVQIVVKDYGIGISKSNQKKIFDKLYRVSTGNIHTVKGFGLGLSYVRAIIEKHNGNIELQSELKKGSTFIINLPFGDEKS